MPLDSKAIEWIFARMVVRYGSTWTAKWVGVPMEAVAKDWAQQLDRVTPRAIKYALGYLPLEFPPTAGQFLEICRYAPEERPPELPGIKASQEQVLTMVADALAKVKKLPRLQWAESLKAREDAGESLTIWQREAWRAALNTDDPRNAKKPQIGDFNPIPPEALPPAMRKKTR